MVIITRRGILAAKGHGSNDWSLDHFRTTEPFGDGNQIQLAVNLDQESTPWLITCKGAFLRGAGAAMELVRQLDRSGCNMHSELRLVSLGQKV
jgi:hypothetical protein